MMTSKDDADSANAARFAWQDDDVFGRIAARYDVLCDVFSLGLHRVWKRRVARCIASEPWSVLLDGATGTGDIILRVLANGPVGTIIATDISPKMLAIARRRLEGHADAVRIERCDAEAMEGIADASVDAYSLSLAL